MTLVLQTHYTSLPNHQQTATNLGARYPHPQLELAVSVCVCLQTMITTNADVILEAGCVPDLVAVTAPILFVLITVLLTAEP